MCDPDPALALWCDDTFWAVCKPLGNEGDACGAPAIPPCRADLACHPQQSDGIGVCGSLPLLGEACVTGAPARGSVTRVSAHPRDTAAGREVHLQQRLRLAFLHRLRREFVLFAAEIPRAAWGRRHARGDQRVRRARRLCRLGPTGFAGTSFTGGRGPAGSRRRRRGGIRWHPGMPPRLGCQISSIAPQDPVIADLRRPDGSAALPIGGTFTLRVALGTAGPNRDPSERCLAHHRNDHGHGCSAVLGCRHLLHRRPARDRLHRRDGPHRHPVRHQRHDRAAWLHGPVLDQRQRAHGQPRRSRRARAIRARTRRRRR